MDSQVIIVGAGPAGATAAKVLAEAGIEVFLIDKAQFPRPKVCAGGLMHHALRDFPYLADFIQNYNRGVHVHEPSLEATLRVEAGAEDPPMMAMTRGRAEFDAALLQLAREAGAQVKEDTRVTGLRVGSDYARVSSEEGSEFTTHIVIGADSATSTIARAVGLAPKWQLDEMGLGVEAEVALTSSFVEKTYTDKCLVHLFLHYGGVPGYGWIFPREDSINLGLGTALQYGAQLRSLFDAFVRDCQRLALLSSDIATVSPQFAQLPSRPPLRPAFCSRVLLAGDAGAFCSPVTGEGIYYAMVSGSLAGEVAASAILEGDYSRKKFSSYEKLWRARLGKELKFHDLAKRKVLTSERRCTKVVRWGLKDPRLGPLFANFLMGRVPVKGLTRRMVWHYLRCKTKELFGRL